MIGRHHSVILSFNFFSPPVKGDYFQTTTLLQWVMGVEDVANSNGERSPILSIS